MVYNLSYPGAWPSGWPVTANQLDEIEQRRWKKGEKKNRHREKKIHRYRMNTEKYNREKKTERAKDRETRRKKRN